MVLLHELTSRLGRSGRVRAVVKLDQLDSLPAHLVEISVSGVDAFFVINANRRCGTTQRGDETDGDLGLCGAGSKPKAGSGGEAESEAPHCCSPSMHRG